MYTVHPSQSISSLSHHSVISYFTVPVVIPLINQCLGFASIKMKINSPIKTSNLIWFHFTTKGAKLVLKHSGSILTKLALEPLSEQRLSQGWVRMGSKAAEYVSRTSIGAYFHSARESRKLVLVIVAIALLLDNMLLTTVGRCLFYPEYFSSIEFLVPIIPEFLYHVRHRYDHLTTTTTQPTVKLWLLLMFFSRYARQHLWQPRSPRSGWWAASLTGSTTTWPAARRRGSWRPPGELQHWPPSRSKRLLDGICF